MRIAATGYDVLCDLGAVRAHLRYAKRDSVTREGNFALPDDTTFYFDRRLAAFAVFFAPLTLRGCGANRICPAKIYVGQISLRRGPADVAASMSA